MDLEQRVQALEQELQILKNQIQATLLDIQEQVLSNTYAGLRSGDSLPPERPAPVMHIQAEPQPQEVVQPSTPVRKVSFSQLSEAESASPNRQDDDHWQVMADLEEWAKKKIELIGVQATADLIRAYTVKGRFTPEERDALIDFLVLQVTSFPDAPIQPHRDPSFNAPAYQPPADEQPSRPRSKAASGRSKRHAAGESDSNEQDDPQSIVLRLIAGVQNAGAGVHRGKK